jgi:hypothetical protein
MRRSLSIFERMEYVSRTMRELIMDVWPESGAQATARGRCATGIGLDSQSVPAPAISGTKSPKKKKPTGAKLRSWRFSILRSRAQSRNR